MQCHCNALCCFIPSMAMTEDEITIEWDDVVLKSSHPYRQFRDSPSPQLKINTSPPQVTLDTLPKDVFSKILSNLSSNDLFSLESVSFRIRELVTEYWKIFCERLNLFEDPTPLCVGWPLNCYSLYSYDNAVDLCLNSVKRWRVVAMRHFLLESFRCVICEQHLKDRLSVDGIYFKHDVLLCFPDCYEIFTLRINEKMLKVCEKFGITLEDLAETDTSYPVLLITDFIRKLREKGVSEKEVFAELRPHIGYTTTALREYYNYVEGIRKYTLIL